MNDKRAFVNKTLNYFIAGVWLANGLFCKILNFVPRHQEIVERILGGSHARLFTFSIGVAEILMAAWIISAKWPRLNIIIQIIAIASMNIIEFFLAPDLLLWGRLNIVFALLLIGIIWYNEYNNRKKITKTN